MREREVAVEVMTRKKEEVGINWKDYRVEDTLPTVIASGTAGFNGPHTVFRQPCAHSCPNCGGELMWGNSALLNLSAFAAHCSNCYAPFSIPKNYMLPILKEALEMTGEAVEIPDPSEEATDTESVSTEQISPAIASSQPQAPTKKVTLDFGQPKAPQVVKTSGERTKICVSCKSPFEPPVRRGRPPVKCPSCS